jgi:hypothetical protein
MSVDPDLLADRMKTGDRRSALSGLSAADSEDVFGTD